MDNALIITIGDKAFGATLSDNSTAAAFKALLPLSVNMSELNGNEKLYRLPTNLPAQPSRPASIQSGDLMLYGANTVVLFYKSFATSYSYTRIGRIHDPAGLERAVGAGSVNVRFAMRPGKEPAAKAPLIELSMLANEDLASVSPALERYRRETLQANLWKRPQLSPRDRSIVTIAALIARNQTAEQAHYLAFALDSGVRPSEISEIITHLAFYAGWGNAMAAVPIAKGVFATRGVSQSELPPASDSLLPLDQLAEAQRATLVAQTVGPVARGLEEYTKDVLFRDLWLRPALAPRDRSLVTVSALIASGQVAQVTFHLNRAMDSGLTKEEAGEVITHLAFYAGWPNAFSAVPVVKDVFDTRPR